MNELPLCTRLLRETHAVLLEGHPIASVSFVAESLGISRSTAGNLVNDLERLGILTLRDAKKRRYRTFLYERYLEILRQGSDPLRV